MGTVLKMNMDELIALMNSEVDDFIIHVQYEMEGQENAKESI
jgi:hypothetical protein